MIIELSGYPNGIITLNGKILRPERSQKVRNHSPDGFNWGYNGSGPAQLSLAILLELTDKEIALNNYQRFKSDVIACLEKDCGFGINVDVTEYIGAIKWEDPYLK